MTNYCNYELIAQLWDEILQKHWDYLDAEETLAKFEMRKELEKRLQDYLCMIPHDKKFFLVETKLVLKRSITQNSDFSAYKAANGFESISQYANNLFTKPWRKEYKVIKMYSGFYQHEIKANLVDSEKLFEAMGYKLMPNQTLVLEGAICPDQVTNVARDAMAAMVECEIMKQIYSGLTAKQLTSSWMEIFNFREKHIGTIPKMVKAMTGAILDKQAQRKNKNVSQENCYHNQQMNACNIHQCVPNPQQPPGHYYNPQPQPTVPQTGYHHGPPPCSVHSHQPVYGSYGTNGQIPPPIPHSKSLDYYEPVLHSGGYINSHYHHPHRHSMDQTFDYGGPQLSQGYDCVDGEHQCGNVTYKNHPYNVSGNRVPLPYDLGTSYPPQHLPPPPLPPQATYYSRLQHPNTEQPFNNGGNDYYCPTMSGQQYLPNTVVSPLVPMDKLIDFDQQQQQHQSNGSTLRGSTYYSKRDKELQPDNYLPTTLLTKQHNNGSVHNHYNQTTIGMEIPPPLFARNAAKASGRAHDKYGKVAVCGEDGYNNKSHYQTTDKAMKSLNLSDFDSFEDDNSSSQPRSNKNMDGIGNYESWNYVFRNLEQQGYNQDNELPDDTAEELDGDGFKTVTDHNHRKSSLSHKRATSALVTQPKSQEPHHAKHNSQTTTTNQERSDSNKLVTQPKVQSSRNTIGTMTLSATASVKPDKTNINPHHQQISAIRPTSNSTIKMTASQSTATNVSNNNNSSNCNNFSNGVGSKKSGIAKNGNLVATNASYCVMAKKANGSAGGNLTGNGTSGDSNHVVTNISTSGATNEWSCQFCTYLNPIGKRICDMCAKSRDFNLEGTKTKATCV